MLASYKYHVRRIAWIFAASGLLVYVMFQLSSDGVIDSEARRKSVGGPFDEQPFREVSYTPSFLCLVCELISVPLR